MKIKKNLRNEAQRCKGFTTESESLHVLKMRHFEKKPMIFKKKADKNNLKILELGQFGGGESLADNLHVVLRNAFAVVLKFSRFTKRKHESRE